MEEQGAFVHLHRAQQCPQGSEDPMQPRSHNSLQEDTSATNRLLFIRKRPPGAFLSQGRYCAHYHQIMGCGVVQERS